MWDWAAKALHEIIRAGTGREFSKAEEKAFVVGVCAGSSTVALALILRSLQKRERSKRNLSDLHHLDDRVQRLQNMARGAPPPIKFLRKQGADNLSFDDEDGRSRIFQVVLTGGPCAGKSSSMEYLAERLRACSFDVYLVPEVPTLLLNGGCLYPGLDGGDKLITFEASLIELQLQMEQTFFSIAQSTGRPSIILYDRGLLDVAAYLPQSLWHSVLNYNQWVRDGMLGVLERYDLIIHLVTAAHGAEKHFRSTVSHLSKSEAIEHARKLDHKILNSYRGHPHHHVIDNSTEFAQKLDRVYELLDDMVRRNSVEYSDSDEE